jgi:hypothetical protein
MVGHININSQEDQQEIPENVQKDDAIIGM